MLLVLCVYPFVWGLGYVVTYFWLCLFRDSVFTLSPTDRHAVFGTLFPSSLVTGKVLKGISGLGLGSTLSAYRGLGFHLVCESGLGFSLVCPVLD